MRRRSTCWSAGALGSEGQSERRSPRTHPESPVKDAFRDSALAYSATAENLKNRRFWPASTCSCSLRTHGSQATVLLRDPLGPTAHQPNGALANAVQSLRSQAVAALEKLAHLSLTQMRRRNSRPVDPASLTRSLRTSREVTARQAHLCRAEVFSGRRNRESLGLPPQGPRLHPNT